MLKFLNKKKQDNKGFSLVELIIVVAIMAILVGLLAPQYIKYVEKSRKSADASNLDEMVNAVQIYAADADVNDSTATDAPSTNLVAGQYTITIKGSGVEAKATDKSNGATDAMLDTAISSNVADYKNIKLKSNKWGGSISAIITVNKNGETTVVYEPDDFATFINKTKKTNTGN